MYSNSIIEMVLEGAGSFYLFIFSLISFTKRVTRGSSFEKKKKSARRVSYLFYHHLLVFFSRKKMRITSSDSFWYSFVHGFLNT